ncbi:MAG TPA: hypothetical protein VLH85_04715 [Levilinea sp.]|nr:hypothetical protein [Levilinea sp.]
MTPASLSGLWWLLACLVPFILVQRWLHRELQGIFLLITRRPAMALGLFSLLFFPGVLLHEVSHFLAARLLWVRTGRFSVIPKALPGGRLRMGYVETAPSDAIRDALIGAAPLVTGSLLIAYLGAYRLGLSALATLALQGKWDLFWVWLMTLPNQADFWLWFYLAFSISSTMLPSASDRRAWLPIITGVLILVVLGLLFGAGPWIVANLTPLINRALRSLALVFGISLVVHAALLLPFWLLRLLLSRLTGLRVG